METPEMFKSSLLNSRVLICCGSGGVGKTTVSAAVGLFCAKKGKNVCLITIDPAKRLAQALGIQELCNQVRKLDFDAKGNLYSMMLDTQDTFNSLIYRYSRSQDQAQEILNNRIFKSLATNLGGTQEYMASEKLYELYCDDRFDVIIVDTPPTRNALDFFESPARLARFLENKLLRILLIPSRRGYLKRVNLAAQAFVKSVSKIAGAELVSDAVDFFRAFEGMEEGFRTRAKEVDRVLKSEETSIILVAAPTRDAIEEAKYFSSKIKEMGLALTGLIVNRALVDFENPRQAHLNTSLEKYRHDNSDNNINEDLAIKVLKEVSERFKQIRARQQKNIEALKLFADLRNVIEIPMLETDVHSLATLTLLAQAIEGA